MISEEILEWLRPVTSEEQAALQGRQTVDSTLYTEDGGSVINARKLMAEGRQIAIRPHTRFVHFPPHSHDYVEAVYMAQGSTVHLINGERIELREGELLFLGQGVRQEILPAGKTDLAVNFIILPQFFDKTLEMLGADESPLRRFLTESLRGDNTGCLYFQVADVLPVQNLVENLLWTLIHDVRNRRSLNQTTMGLLFMQLLSHADRLSWASPEESALLSVFRYIEENYRDGSLTALADRLHYDLYWLSRMVRQRTGRTYTELLQEKRLSQAAWLLRTAGLDVAGAAGAVGYTNLSYFHRIFRARFGQSPAKYRATHQYSSSV